MSNSFICSTLGGITGISAPEYGHRWEGGLVEGTGRIKQIRYCSDGQVRIRTVVKRARWRPTGKFSSWKNDRMMHWEWPDERNAFSLLDFRSDVAAYREQPCEIIYLDDDGKQVPYSPDIEVLTASGREFWEVEEPQCHAQSGPVGRRTEILSEALAAYGLKYRTAGADELNKQPRLKTVEKILGFGCRPVSQMERVSIARQLVHSGRLKWDDACSGRLGSNGREILCRLVLEGYLQIDTDSPFGETTEFVPGDRSW